MVTNYTSVLEKKKSNLATLGSLIMCLNPFLLKAFHVFYYYVKRFFMHALENDWTFSL